MEGNWLYTLAAMPADHSPQASFRYVSALLSDLGFEYCCYGIRLPLPLSAPLESYFEMTLAEDGTEHSLFSLNELFAAHGHPHYQAQRIWPAASGALSLPLERRAVAAGLRAGMTQAICALQGSTGVLLAARRTPADNLSQPPLKAALLTIAQRLHTQVTQVLMETRLPETSTVLTPRQQETLRWTSEGKTSAEIARILCISERTVQFHISNAQLKLDATNRIHAVAKAQALRMINS